MSNSEGGTTRQRASLRSPTAGEAKCGQCSLIRPARVPVCQRCGGTGRWRTSSGKLGGKADRKKK